MDFNRSNTPLTREGNQNHSIIRSVRSLGIDVPANVQAEVDLYRSVQTATRDAHDVVQRARVELRSCPAANWDDAVHKLSDAINHQRVLEEGLNAPLISTASDRLNVAVLQAESQWTAEIVEKLNQLVDSTGWNEYARNLPTFKQKVHVLDLTREQGAAIESCRSAAAAFKPYWDVYVRLGDINGYEMGISRETSTNLDMFFMLSDGSWGHADGAIALMSGAAFGSDSMREYSALQPFIFPNLVGAELNFATPRAAEERRRVRQGLG